VTPEEQAFEVALRNMPDRRPRPAGELELLEKVWEPPKGWRLLSVVNNNYIGPFYVGAALLFFLLAGILALLIRLQLAAPLNEVLGQETYNQVFTMHGTVMMFLFAVPAVEAMGVLLLPQMLAARDLPFPRLSAYAFWAYFIGGLVFFTSLFHGAAPDGGWFMYPPLTGIEYSPGDNADWWLLGIGFIEISAIAGAIEIIVGLLKTRPPGMTLDKMPVFAWAMLAFAGMIIIGFPAVILSTILLEIERAFDWPFFIAERGGDPLLWQHLFWFFGHPEVYIIFIPAAGMTSMIVATIARTPLVGYHLVVLAVIATAFLSFGVWVHHMFTTGLPHISTGFFSAASMAVSIPAGIQVFAWIATLMAGERVKLNVPGLFVIGGIVIFVMGGLTGVMVAMVPFDWQAHDTYFIVAHLHYVLIGGMVFPLIGAVYYWTPMASERHLSERLGKWAFWLMFTGMHLTFLVMHWTGLMGMPRRVFTYLPEQGLTDVNLLSTIGAIVFAAGAGVFFYDLARHFRIGNGEGNPYDGGTLEWLPNGNYAARSIPVVTTRDPVWNEPELADDVERGHWFLPRAATGRRETIITSPIKATPQFLMIVATDGWWHFWAAVGTAGFFLLLTVKLLIPAFAFGLLAVYAVFRWMEDMDKGPDHPPVDVGGGLMLPVYATGTRSHAVWASAVLVVVLGMIFACAVFGHLFLWSGRPHDWPPNGIEPPGAALLRPALLYAASFAVILAARRFLDRRWPFIAALGSASALLGAALVVEIGTYGQAGIWPTESGYGASVYLFAALNGQLVAMLVLFALFLGLKARRGHVNSMRCLSYQCMAILWGYAAAQSLVGLATVASGHLLGAGS
jgi:cytochrome c oxidase subunit I+III